MLMARAWRQAQVEDQLVRVTDGAEVIDYLKGEGAYHDRQQHPLPRLLLLDIKMPQKSGMEVLQWLHAQPRFKDLPTVILTSSGASSDVHEAARLGVKGYLIKPVDVTEWIVKVKTVTSQCR
jgi:CheY-like chemotaxis protein